MQLLYLLEKHGGLLGQKVQAFLAKSIMRPKVHLVSRIPLVQHPVLNSPFVQQLENAVKKVRTWQLTQFFAKYLIPRGTVAGLIQHPMRHRLSGPRLASA